MWQDCRGEDWDTELPPARQCLWENLVNAYCRTPELKFPRWVPTFVKSYHVFTDASDNMVAAAIYMVWGRNSRLVAAKAKLAPTAAQATPCQELTAATLGATLWWHFEASLGGNCKAFVKGLT